MKMRKEKELNIDCLGWINSISETIDLLPTAQKAYTINFNRATLYQRKLLEDFVFEFFEVQKGRHEVIVCWRETAAVIFVF